MHSHPKNKTQINTSNRTHIEIRKGEDSKANSQPDKAVSSQKSSFDWAVKIARWLSTTGLKIFLQFWYSKTPVFALPPDWFPYYVEWILSFPRAPIGNVSIQVWSNVCASTIAVVGEILGAVIASALAPKQEKQKQEVESNLKPEELD